MTISAKISAMIPAIRERFTDSMLPEAAVVSKLTRTPDDSMGSTQTYTPQAATTCRVAPLGGGMGAAMAEQVMAGRIGTDEAWMITFPGLEDVDLTDRVAVNGRDFEVVAVLARRSWEMTCRVVCVEMK